MTLQEVFDKIWDHFVTNKGRPSIYIEYGGAARCKYRGPNEQKCGIGVLIPDDQYDEEMESYTVTDLVRVYPELIINGSNIKEDLKILQMIHDDSAMSCVGKALEIFTSTIKTALEIFRLERGLKIAA